ncbi:MFS transporter, partial [Candidatus Bathyarchaeota archaeon]|nr:MFS transporter [Candidatus Bathyarchaeota archaeon]
GGGQYWNIFITRLGATTVELGLITSLSHAVMALLSIPSGWLTDRINKMKRLYLVGRALSLPTSLLRFLARTWPFCILVEVWQNISMRVMGPASQIIFIGSLSNKDRISGLSFHRMIRAIAGIVAPMISAVIISHFGGLDSADNIRPLFLIQFVIGIIIFILLIIQMQEVTFTRGKRETSVLSHFYSVLKEVPGLKLLLLRQIVQTFISHVRMPFRGIYMVDVKGADEFILGWRGTVSTALTVFLSIPAGRLADSFGRKKISYFSRVFGWVAILITIFTPPTHPEYLIIASLMEGFQMALFIGWTAFDQELIPLEARGRWSGITMLAHGIIGVIAPIMGGIIWNLNPNYIWWINLIGDALIILPIMIMIPEVKATKKR